MRRTAVAVWTNSLDVCNGSYLTDYTLIDTVGKRPETVSVTKNELVCNGASNRVRNSECSRDSSWGRKGV